jgi:hypothetical protein
MGINSCYGSQTPFLLRMVFLKMIQEKLLNGINKPSTTLMTFGGDAGTFLGTQNFRAYFTYGSGNLNAGAVNQYIRSNKYSNFYSYIDSMRIKL